MGALVPVQIVAGIPQSRENLFVFESVIEVGQTVEMLLLVLDQIAIGLGPRASFAPNHARHHRDMVGAP